MQSPWFGGIIMLLVVVATVVWVWWAIRRDKEKP